MTEYMTEAEIRVVGGSTFNVEDLEDISTDNVLNDIGRFSFTLSGESSPSITEGNLVSIHIGEIGSSLTKVFSGEVRRVRKTREEGESIYYVEGVNGAGSMQYRHTNNTYTNENARTVILDLISELVTDGLISSDYTHIAACSTNINYTTGNESVLDSIKNISEQVGYDFYVDPDNELHWFERNSIASGITVNEEEVEDLEYYSEVDNIVNDFTVLGDEYNIPENDAWCESLTDWYLVTGATIELMGRKETPLTPRTGIYSIVCSNVSSDVDTLALRRVINMDLSTVYAPTRLCFQIGPAVQDGNVTRLRVKLRTNSSNYFYYDLTNVFEEDPRTWRKFAVDISDPNWIKYGSPDLSDIEDIVFEVTIDVAQKWGFFVDDVHFEGAKYHGYSEDASSKSTWNKRTAPNVLDRNIKSNEEAQEIADRVVSEFKEPKVVFSNIRLTQGNETLVPGETFTVQVPELPSGSVTKKILQVSQRFDEGKLDTILTLENPPTGLTDLVNRTKVQFERQTTAIPLTPPPTESIAFPSIDQLDGYDPSWYSGTGILEIIGEHETITSFDLIYLIWEWVDGVWTPKTKTLPDADSLLRFKNSSTDDYIDIQLIMVDHGGYYDPLFGVSGGLLVKKDITAGGFVSANQGLIGLGSGMRTVFDPPGVWLSHSNFTPFYDDYTSGDRIQTLASEPANPVNYQCYIKSSDSHLYWYNKDKTKWVDGGHIEDIDFNYDTFYIRKAGYAPPLPPFEQAGVPIQSSDLGHLRCMNITSGNHNPIFDDTYGLGSPDYAWQGICTHTVYTDALKKLNGDTWDFGVSGTFNVDVTVEKATPKVNLKSTSGSDASLVFYDDSVLKMSLSYSSSLDRLFVYDHLGAQTIFNLDHDGNLGALGDVTVGDSLTVTNDFTLNGVMLTNLVIEKATPQVSLKASTASDASILFYDANVHKMNLSYSTASDILFVYDVLGSKTLASLTHDGNFGVYNNVTVAGQFVSTKATGTAPLNVSSTTLCTNLNADLWDGYQFSDYINQAVKSTSTPTFSKLTLNVAAGTAPLTITSDTVCTNLNADMLDGHHWSEIGFDQSLNTTNDVRFNSVSCDLNLKVGSFGSQEFSVTVDSSKVYLTSHAARDFYFSTLNGYKTIFQRNTRVLGNAEFGSSTYPKIQLGDDGIQLGAGTGATFDIALTRVTSPSLHLLINKDTQIDGALGVKGINVTGLGGFTSATSSISYIECKVTDDGYPRLRLKDDYIAFGSGSADPTVSLSYETSPSTRLQVNGNFQVTGNANFLNISATNEIGCALLTLGKIRIGSSYGESGQVLTSQGYNNAPIWTTPSSSWNGGTVSNGINLTGIGPELGLRIASYIELGQFINGFNPYIAFNAKQETFSGGINRLTPRYGDEHFCSMGMFRGETASGTLSYEVYKSGISTTPVNIANFTKVFTMYDTGKVLFPNTDATYGGIWINDIRLYSWDDNVLGISSFVNIVPTADDAKIDLRAPSNKDAILNLMYDGDIKAVLAYDSSEAKTYLAAYASSGTLSQLHLNGSKIVLNNDTDIYAPLNIRGGNGFFMFDSSGTQRFSCGYNLLTTLNAPNNDMEITANGELRLYGSSRVVIWGGKHLTPESTGGSGQLGNSTYWWHAIYNDYYYAKNGGHPGTFDAYDDLAIVKQWGEETPTLPETYDSSKLKPLSTDPFSILKNPDNPEYYNIFNMISFGLGCSKALAKHHDETSDIMLALYDGIETLDEKMVRLEEENTILKDKLTKMDDLEGRIIALESTKITGEKN